MRVTYHHGDLRRAILDEAVRAIATDGPAALSLRDLARRAGVSHAAPAHHFKDKAGLLTAIAIDGYEQLAVALEAGSTLLDLGAAYVRFALDHPAHFEVMFRPDLYHTTDPDLAAARARTRVALQAQAGPRRAVHRSLAAWSLAHGFATLWATGSMARVAGDQDPVRLFRAMARAGFADPSTVE
jgi:AcrR family transcriptional regulator